MIPAAIVSPAIAATPGAAPQGAAPTGGVFAALFAEIAAAPAIGNADPDAMPNGGGASVTKAFPDVTAGAAPPVDPDSGEPQVKQQDSDPTADVPAPPAAASMLLPATIQAPVAEASTARIATPISPLTPAPVRIGTAPEALPPTVTPIAGPTPPADRGEITPPTSKEPAPVPIPPVASAAAPSADAPATASTPEPALTALPVQAALPQLRMPAVSTQTRAAMGTAIATTETEDASPDANAAQQPSATPPRKPAPAASNAKPAAGDAKPTPAQTAASANGTAIFTASVPPDAALPTLNIDAVVPVKTVPLSNLANLPSGAAVTAIGAVIASEAASGTNRFLIRLDPPELGRIDVRLRFGRDGEVHARLIADRPETASLLMRDAAALERALNASGMRTDSGVDVMLRDSSGGFARSDGGFGEDAPPSSPYSDSMAATDSIFDTPALIRPASAGRLDLTV